MGIYKTISVKKNDNSMPLYENNDKLNYTYAANYNNKYITIEAQQNYYYYLIADSIEASYTVTLPELTGDTIIFN